MKHHHGHHHNIGGFDSNILDGGRKVNIRCNIIVWNHFEFEQENNEVTIWEDSPTLKKLRFGGPEPSRNRSQIRFEP
jgi:hypothetical protein